MKLLVADDHMLFRDALVQFIERSEPEAVVMQAKDMHEVMNILEDRPALDLVLLDMRMPGMDGLLGLEKMRQAYPDTRVALLSGLAEKHHVQKAMELGACGFFPKTMSGKAMLSGVHKILEGENYVAMDHNTNDVMPSYYNGGGVSHREGAADFDQDSYRGADGAKLTPRERQVLSFLLKGSSNKEIALALDLEVVTVKLHVRSICRKLKAKNRTQAALIAKEMGFSPES